jgi:hypothetical protein
LLFWSAGRDIRKRRNRVGTQFVPAASSVLTDGSGERSSSLKIEY